MQRSSEISARRLASKIGSEQTVLIDGVDGGVAIGRTKGDAPEIDGVVRVRAEDAGVSNGTDHKATLAALPRPGDFARVRITGADAYDLAGVVIPN